MLGTDQYLIFDSAAVSFQVAGSAQESFSSTETFVDHTGSFWSSFPYWFIKRNPEEPMIGSFLFATHTTVFSGTL
uniref:Uncharacterized protein n=1 Tax=Salix viminalis TaxID=40686 RepID=A0A6N2LPT5_SALVM